MTARLSPAATTRHCWPQARSIAKSTNPKWTTEPRLMPEPRPPQVQNLPEPPPLMGRSGPGTPRIMGKVEKAKDRRGTVLRLWGYLRRQKGALMLTTLMVIVSTGLNLLGPFLLGLAIDRYIISGDLAGLARLC